MKTILINIFDHAVAKNIFTRGFAARMKAAPEVRLVAVVPERRLEDFKTALEPLGVKVVGRPLRFATAAEAFAMFLSRNSIPTHSVQQIQEEGLDGSGRLPLHKYLVARTAWLFGHFFIFRRLLKQLLPLMFDESVFDRLMRELEVDLAFATTMYAVDDIRFLKAARALGIKTLGMVKSWDNLTSKDFMLISPDHLIVHNEVVAEEARRFHGYSRSRMTLTGVPQFDGYVDADFPEPREPFFRKLNLDPSKALITYSCMGRWLVRHEREIIRMLSAIVQSGMLAKPAQLLVRFHPAYPDDKEALASIPAIVMDVPGSPVKSKDAWKADWRFTADDVRHLASTLRWSNVLLNCGSTMMLDGACFGTPIVGIAFDGEVTEPSYWRSSRRLFEREHCKSVVETGGVRVVRDKNELIAALNRYLTDPRADSEKRVAIVHQQTGTLDGKAGERLAEALIGTLRRS